MAGDPLVRQLGLLSLASEGIFPQTASGWSYEGGRKRQGKSEIYPVQMQCGENVGRDEMRMGRSRY